MKTKLLGVVVAAAFFGVVSPAYSQDFGFLWWRRQLRQPQVLTSLHASGNCQLSPGCGDWRLYAFVEPEPVRVEDGRGPCGNARVAVH
jgi:hypothetical protein